MWARISSSILVTRRSRNLAPNPPMMTRPPRWSVGASATKTSMRRPRSSPDLAAANPIPDSAVASRRRLVAEQFRSMPVRPPIQRPPLPDERAYLERAGLYSARSFIGLFFVVASVFAALTGVICVIPSASADLMRRMPVIGPEFVQPTPLENLAGVSDVQSSYQTVKGGHDALVLTGVVHNNSTVPLHTVQIGVRLLDAAQHELASSAVYCGTTLSPRMIGEMTPHELEFLQKLDPQKTFVLEPGHAAPFLMVFIDPPRNLNHFAVSVSKAQPPRRIGTAGKHAPIAITLSRERSSLRTRCCPSDRRGRWDRSSAP